MKTSDLLQQVHDLLEPNGAWGQAAPARDAKGNVLASTSKLAVCWCLIGAVQNVCYKNETTCYLVDKALLGTLAVLTGGINPSYVSYNDTHTHREVLDLVLAARDREAANGR